MPDQQPQTIVVDVPGLGPVEYPASLKKEQIEAAIRQALVDKEGGPVARGAAGAVRAAGLSPESLSGAAHLLGRAGFDAVTGNLGDAAAIGGEIGANLAAPLRRVPGAIQMARAGHWKDAGNELAASVPVLGPASESASRQFARGNVAGGIGEMAGTIAAPFLLEGAGKLGRLAAELPQSAATGLAGRALDASPAEARAVLDQGLLRGGVHSGVRTAERRAADLTNQAADAAAGQPRGMINLSRAGLGGGANVRQTYRDIATLSGEEQAAAAAPVRARLTNPRAINPLPEDLVRQAEQSRLSAIGKSDPADLMRRAQAADTRTEIARVIPQTRTALEALDRLDTAQHALVNADHVGGRSHLPPLMSSKESLIPYLLKRGMATGSQYGFDLGSLSNVLLPAIVRASIVQQLSGGSPK